MTSAIRRLAAGLPRDPGVYRFRDARGRVLYVGRATELRARVGSYGGDLRDRRHLRRMVPAVTRIEAVACESVHEAAWLERNLLEESLPRWNRTAGGEEVPAYLRLDARPATAGLRLTHEAGPPVAGVRIFGPYLGGTRARLAVSALHRAHPLAAAGSGLTGAERELAARRGVSAADRENLAEAVAAVLRRDPVAVAAARRSLETVRDRAATALAFEMAGRVQEEIRALEWVTAAQQVTTLEPVDVTVQGWADGWLVSFAVRAGRVRSWSQRRSARPPQEPPPAWAGFARRNAELAATLARLAQ
ncbi:GIY-YIG nuclease family protein [Actinoplanes sp. CA-051413]|uniref:GIY-YIG nuclease family protein n=1 Tax=Actinoplanes sp. CA-051413 TaxID=3239899 RepID=UPI003D966ED7